MTQELVFAVLVHGHYGIFIPPVNIFDSTPRVGPCQICKLSSNVYHKGTLPEELRYLVRPWHLGIPLRCFAENFGICSDLGFRPSVKTVVYKGIGIFNTKAHTTDKTGNAYLASTTAN
jgi:hypothetical protein